MTTKKLKFRTAYNTGNENYSELHNDDGLTEQHHAETCDINKILAQFMETGILPTSTNKDPQYGDVSEHDFQEVQNQLANAKTLFEELSDPVKAQFDNKPFKFLHFAEDPKNMDSLVRILKPNGVITAQVGSQDKKPKQVEKWLNVFNKNFGNTTLDRVYIPSFDCSWNFSSSINH